MTDDQGFFDFEQSRKGRDFGMGLAAANREELLLLAREAAHRLGNEGGVVTADMVQRHLIETVPGYRTSDLGNAAGSIFKGEEWTPVGHYLSERVRNHAAEQKTWMLTKFALRIRP